MASLIRQMLFLQMVHTVNELTYQNITQFGLKHSFSQAKAVSLLAYTTVPARVKYPLFDPFEPSAVLLLSQLGFVSVLFIQSLINCDGTCDINKLYEYAFQLQISKFRLRVQLDSFFFINIRPLDQKSIMQFLKFYRSILSCPILASIFQEPYKFSQDPSSGGKTPLVCLFTTLFWAQQKVQLVSARFLVIKEAPSTQMSTNMASFTIQFLMQDLHCRICCLRVKYYLLVRIMYLLPIQYLQYITVVYHCHLLGMGSPNLILMLVYKFQTRSYQRVGFIGTIQRRHH